MKLNQFVNCDLHFTQPWSVAVALATQPGSKVMKEKTSAYVFLNLSNESNTEEELI